MNQRQVSYLTFALTLCVALLSPIGVFRTEANPSAKKPGSPLNVHGTIDGAEKIADKLYALREEMPPIIAQYHKDSKNPPGKQTMAAIGDLWKGMRDAEHLKHMGEPAGFDLAVELAARSADLGFIAIQYSNTSEGRKLKEKIRQKRMKARPKLQKTIARAQQMLAGGQLDSFEKLMEGEGTSLAADLSLFVSSQEKAQMSLNFYAVLASGDSRIRLNRGLEYLKVAESQVAKELEIANRFQSEAVRLRDVVMPKATVAEDEPNPVPEALETLLQAWGTASASILRAHAIRSAINPVHYQQDNGQASGQVDTKMAQQSTRLQETAIRTIASFLQSAAQGVSAESAPQVYSELLKKISVAQRRMGADNNKLFEACEKPLSRIAEKNPDLTGRISIYRRATKEPMRWRRDFAKEHSTHLTKDYLSAASVLSTQSSPEDPKFPKQKVGPAYRYRWSADIMKTAGPQLVGKKVAGLPAVRLIKSKPIGVVPYQANYFENVVLRIEIEKEVESLRNATLVSETYGPLTFETADAISSAEMMDYQAIGGVIVNVYYEPLLVRFATLSDFAYVLSPLGTVPAIEPELYNGSIRHPLFDAICWRLDVQPEWAHHKYFTVRADSK